MNNKPLDLTKPVQTRDGLKARILCTDRVNHPSDSTMVVVALVTHTTDNGLYESIETYTKEGAWLADGRAPGNNLVNVPVKKSGWLNIYGVGTDTRECRAHPTREAADAHALPSRVACAEIAWTE